MGSLFCFINLCVFTKPILFFFYGCVCVCVCLCVLVAQLLCNLLGCSLPGSSVHGVFQARILELPFPSPGDLADLEFESGSPVLQADSTI